MFKSKKRLLSGLIALLGVSAVAATGVVFRGDLLGGPAEVPVAKESSAPGANTGKSDDSPASSPASNAPPALDRLTPPDTRMMAPSGDRGGAFGATPPQPNSPATFSSRDDAPIVRANDDGSFRPTSAPMPPTQLHLSDQPSENSPPSEADSRSVLAAYPPESSQRFLTSSSDEGSPSPPELGPPGELAPPANNSSDSTQVSPAGPPPRTFNGYGDGGGGASSIYAAGPSRRESSPSADGNSATGPSVQGTPPNRFDGNAGGVSRLQPSASYPSAHAADQRPPLSATGATGYAPETGGAAGEPGPKQLEGIQSPSLTIEKVAPGEVQVGKQANFLVKVRNVGQVDAEEVVVFDQTPRGTRYVGSTPEASRAQDGSLMWQLGTLKSGEEATITLQLVPLQEGQIGSIARVSFAAKASASTICTKPLLTVEHTGPSSVLIGESVNVTIVISNPGTGVATGVTLEEDVPDGLTHPAGNELEYEIGQLRPGESRKLELSMTAAKPGLISNLLLVRGDGNLVAEDRLELEVVAPQLDLALTGPSKRYLERQATYNVRIANPGTAAAKNIELVTYLPKGLKFVSTDNHGQYDAQNHAVYWSLEELPPRMTGDVSVTAIPIETGQQKLRVEGRGDLGLTAAYDQEVNVEGLAELFFQVVDSADPIEVDSETEYEIRVINQGSKTDTNVRVIAQLPVDLDPVGGDGPTRVRVDGQNVVFEPLARLAPKGSAVYKVRVRGARPGDHRVRVQVVSDEVRTPVNKEESTRVYADQ